jgi:hypothetical protein
MRRGESSERCFFIETILGSCWATYLPFLPSRLGEDRAASGAEVEKGAEAVAVRDIRFVVVEGDGLKRDRIEAGVWKSR